jgi:hypothetical protein
MGRKEKTTPKAYQVRIPINALQNIDEITGYIAFINHQPLNAIKVGDAIFATIDKIELNPLHLKNVRNYLPKQRCTERQPAIPGQSIYKITPTKILFLAFYIVPDVRQDSER